MQLHTRTTIHRLACFALFFACVTTSSAAEYKKLYKFKGFKREDGSSPNGGLLLDAAGNLYGTTYNGGKYKRGTAFKLTHQPDGNWKETILLHFSGKHGAYPNGELILDQVGNLYGTTKSSGRFGSGVAFRLSPNPDGSWSEKILHNFDFTGTGGITPVGGLIFDSAGNLYGATSEGGPGDSHGVAYRLSPNPDGSWTETVIHGFLFNGGAGEYWPSSSLVFDSASNLYGTLFYGGVYAGAVYKLAPNPDGSWTETILHDFQAKRDGCFPVGRLSFSPAGKLYGVTEGACGTDGYGSVFELAPNPDGSWSEQLIHRFHGQPGPVKPNSIGIDSRGNLYGTTTYGGGGDCFSGAECGTVFKLVPNPDGTWHMSMAHRFNGSDGAAPSGPVIFDAAGNLYGPASAGGSKTGVGVVFKIKP
jgi:hypothetical protein